MKNEKIIYSAILRKKHTILTEFTDCSGNFSQITVAIMDEVINSIELEPQQYKAKFKYGKYIFHILKDYKIYILIMTTPTKPRKNSDILYLNFLFNVHEDISKKIDFKSPGKLQAYSFSFYTPELKAKVIEFNKGKIIINDLIANKQNKFEQFEFLNNKIFSHYNKFPILSNEQVHADKNIIPKEGIYYDNNNDIGETDDSFKEDILGSNISKDMNIKLEYNLEDNDLIAPIKSIEETEFDLNFRPRKRKKYSKIIIPIIILIFIVLLLLDMFVFKLIIKI